MAYTFKHGDRPLEGYVIQRAVGQGGFGEVYYALSDGGREVALKYLKNNPEIELRGVTQCMNLKSPHLVSIFDVKKGVDDSYFIVMEYISGPSLRDLMLAEPKGLGVPKAAYFAREIAKGLAYLHDRGIVHRDLKPGNIFYEDGYVKIGDYGLSKFISVSRHSAQTASVGTVHYMAPEVGSGNYSKGIDIYALGVMLYEMLLGRVPFEGATMGEVLMKHLMAQPAVDELPPPFPEVIRKALAKDPKDRYQTVDEMVSEIFGVEDVQNSLAGFNPMSLSGAARHVAANIDPSPVPSPNPPGQGWRHAETVPVIPGVANREGFGAAKGGLPPRLASKLDRVADKVHRRMEKLAGVPLPRRGRVGEPKPADRVGRWSDSWLISGGLMAALLLLIGFGTEDGGLAVGAVGLSSALTLGVLCSQRWAVDTASRPHAAWRNRIMHLICCAIPMVVASAPMFASTNRDHGERWGMMLSLLATSLFLDWRERMRTGARGEMSGGKAFSWAILSFLGTAILTEGESGYMWTAAAIAASASLMTQLFAWRIVSTEARPIGPAVSRKAEERTGPRGVEGVGSGGPTPARSADAGRAAELLGQAPVGQRVAEASALYGIPVEPRRSFVRRASLEPLPALRPMWQRALGSFFAFIFFGGTVAMVIVNLTQRMKLDERAGLTIGTAAGLAMMVFALRMTTVRRRMGMWRDVFQPLLMSIFFAGVLGFAGAAAVLRMGDRVPGDQRIPIVPMLEVVSRARGPWPAIRTSAYRDEMMVFGSLSGACAILLVAVSVAGRGKRYGGAGVKGQSPFVRGMTAVVAAPQGGEGDKEIPIGE